MIIDSNNYLIVNLCEEEEEREKEHVFESFGLWSVLDEAATTQVRAPLCKLRNCHCNSTHNTISTIYQL